MSVEIPKELQEKLKIIERETDLFSQTPKKPSSFTLYFWIVCAVIAGGAVRAMKSEDSFMMLGFYLTIAGLQIAEYFNQKKVFKMYSNACEIINYYKKNEAKKSI